MEKKCNDKTCRVEQVIYQMDVKGDVIKSLAKTA